MLFWGGRKRKFKPRRGGRTVKRKCPECGSTAEFREGDAKDSYSVYFVNLFDDDYQAFQCSSCAEIMGLDKTLEPELTAGERRELEQRRTRELEAARRDREQQEAATRRQVDEELAAIKRRLDKS